MILLKFSIERLIQFIFSCNSVIIFKNTGLLQYADGIDYLISKGFKKTDFLGLSPVTPHNNYVSVFIDQTIFREYSE